MKKNWNALAEAAGLAIPDIERIAPALDGLEDVFRPLARSIPHDLEPAVVFRPLPPDGDDPR
ncbi:MAG: hypothetical protein HYR60_13380 [Acidobacteria bacterium]|nr:hypothetical protein [Acidobacteriota bacterium]